MYRKERLATVLIIGLFCLGLLSCGSGEDEPIYKAEDRELSGTGGLYDIGGGTAAPEGEAEDVYESPFGLEEPEGIRWTSSLQTAKSAAKHGSGKKILLWFTNSSCAECRKIESEVFTSEPVIQQADKYVWVRWDTDANPEMTYYYIKDHEPPVLMWLSQEGNSYHVLYGGFDDPETLAAYLERWH